MKRLFTILSKFRAPKAPRSLGEILGTFNRAIGELEKLADDNAQRAAAHTARISFLVSAREDLNREAVQARGVAAKIRNLTT